jgi:GTP-binding protein
LSQGPGDVRRSRASPGFLFSNIGWSGTSDSSDSDGAIDAVAPVAAPHTKSAKKAHFQRTQKGASFLDLVVVRCLAGRGGDGSRSLLRERHMPRGGPDGGDGGKGGDVVLRAASHLTSLHGIRRLLKAPEGAPGAGDKCTGKAASPLVIHVPVGTRVTRLEGEDGVNGRVVVGELLEPEQQLLVAKGGPGGLGNIHFKSSTNRSPRQTTPGRPGEAFQLELEMTVIADVGLVGFPNAGKSTLLATLTRAKPKVAPYAFTTLTPNIGVVQYRDGGVVRIADLPGIVEGAHLNVGLGHAFLKHCKRTRTVAYVLDTAGSEGRDPVRDMKILLDEMKRYDPALQRKQAVIIANKMDLSELKAPINLERLQRAFGPKGFEVIPISAKNAINTMQVGARLRELTNRAT